MRPIVHPRLRTKLKSGRAILSLTACTFLTLLANAVPVFAVEHPGSIGNASCASCHASKLRGKSVHSAMATSCAVCHVMQTQGDMTTVSLAAPKERICFSCHEKAESLRLHQSAAKGQCLDCHDAHSSDREMLLRIAQAIPVRGKSR